MRVRARADRLAAPSGRALTKGMVLMGSPYDAAWRRLRLRVLHEEHHRCYEPGCTRPATTVDHIVPVEEAPHLRLVRSNLRASCTKHNYGRAPARTARMAKMNRQPAAVREW